MSYALVIANAIQSEGALPGAAKRLDTGQWVSPPGGVWTDAQAATCGYLPVVNVARPADTPTQTSDRSVVLAAGVPTETWTTRAKTAPETTGDTAATNSTTLAGKVQAALTANTTYLALTTKTNAQVTAQVARLTRETNALLRQVWSQLSDVSDT